MLGAEERRDRVAARWCGGLWALQARAEPVNGDGPGEASRPSVTTEMTRSTTLSLVGRVLGWLRLY
jgi:hypothetical protein